MSPDLAPTDDPSPSLSPSRRQVLLAGAGALAAIVLTACGSDGESASSAPDTTAGTAGTSATTPTTGAPAGGATVTTLAPTPSCTDDDDATPEQTAGPFFKANSPQQTDLRAGAGGGTALDVSGAVVTTACQPVAQAKIEFWQANDAGEYDNTGYTLRGYQFTDAQGRYAVKTVVPGLYPGRTRHIHVRVQAPNAAVLTTQLYFPGEPRNASDGLYQSELLMDVKDAPSGGTGAGKNGTFTFVLSG